MPPPQTEPQTLALTWDGLVDGVAAPIGPYLVEVSAAPATDAPGVCREFAPMPIGVTFVVR